MQFKSGFSDENSMIRPVLAPGPIREACGFYYQEFSNIKSLPLRDNPFGVEDNAAVDWMEFLIPETARALAYYDHPYFSQYPAVTINDFGKGTLLYEGSVFSDQIQARIIKEAIERAGIINPDHKYTWPLIAKSGRNDNGNLIHFYYNYSSESVDLTYPHPSGKELVSNKAISEGDPLVVEPWDVMIIEEGK